MQYETLRAKTSNPAYIDVATYDAFKADVLHGLSQPQKSLPCKWFYDEAGSVLFEEITRTPEYYLTRTEARMLQEIGPELLERIPGLKVLIEPGSGSSVKTRYLLKALPQLKEYIPLDIAEEMLFDTAKQLKNEFPHLVITPYVHDFSMPVAPMLKLEDRHERLVFFPGSTIGNFAPRDAQRLLRSFDALVRRKGWLLIGVDTTQDKNRLLNAYNDQAGITARFNKNILERANRELGADFDIDKFEHRAIYTRMESRVEMHLVSRQAQVVEIAGHTFVFEPGETIHTENSYKYSLESFEQLAETSGWQIKETWSDDSGTGFKEILLISMK